MAKKRFFRQARTSQIVFADGPRTMRPTKDVNVYELFKVAKGCFPGRCVQDVRVHAGKNGVLILSEIN